MEFAKNCLQKVVCANSAEYGIYFCTECDDLAYLRKSQQVTPHFYHFRYNSDCSLCNTQNYGQASFKLNESQKACDILRKNSSQKNWFEAINCLLRNEHLYLLSNCEWAIGPISLYINNHIEIITHETIYKLITLFIDNNSYKFSAVLMHSLMIPLFNDEDRKLIIDKYFHKKEILTNTVLTGLIKADSSLIVMYYLYKHLSKYQQNAITEKKKYGFIKILVVVDDKKTSDLKCIQEYNYFKTLNIKNYSEKEWLGFLNIILKLLQKKPDRERIYMKIRSEIENSS